MSIITLNKEQTFCNQCGGNGKAMGLGFISATCSVCDGTGRIYAKQDDAKQNQVESAKDSQAKEDVDKSPSDSVKAKRQVKRKDASLGLSADDISEIQNRE